MHLRDADAHQAVAFAWERLETLLDDGLAAIVERHWLEVGVHKEDVPLACDWDRYQEMEDKGILKVMSARRGEELVGYASYFVLPHLHYATTLHATNDAIWVDPAVRGVGIKLIKEAEKALVKLAVPRCIRILYHAKDDVAADRGTYGRVFEMLGYHRFEATFGKVAR